MSLNCVDTCSSVESILQFHAEIQPDLLELVCCGGDNSRGRVEYSIDVASVSSSVHPELLGLAKHLRQHGQLDGEATQFPDEAIKCWYGPDVEDHEG